MGTFQSQTQGQYSGSSMLEQLGLKDVKQGQLEPVLKKPWVELVGTFCVSLALTGLFWNETVSTFVTLWAVFSIIVLAASALVLAYFSDQLKRGAGRDAIALRVGVLSVIRGAVWGMLFIGTMPYALGGHQLLMAWCLAGLLATGAFSMWTIPAAALSFTGLVTLGGAAGMYMAPIEYSWLAMSTVVLLFAIFTRMIMVASQRLRTQLIEQDLVVAKNETITLLLRDFEKDASEWLWETDAGGRLTRGAAGFFKNLGLSENEVINCDLAGLIDARSQVLAGLARTPLFELFAQEKPFSHEVFGLNTILGERFIRITAKPLNDKDGKTNGWRGVAANVTIEKQAEQRVEQLAQYDALTGLPNRPSFYETFEADLRATYGQSLWLMLIDLDGFKAVNDSMGHDVGDQLLFIISGRLQKLQSKHTKIGRIGGDEFGVIVHGDMGVTDKIWKSIVKEVQVPVVINGQNVRVTCSIGIAKCSGLQLVSSRIMRMAEMALFRAKVEGKGKACYYDEEMDLQERKRTEFERDFKEALERDQFTLEYQPICDAANHEVNAYEALVRWRHPRNGTVPPAMFIPFAEQSGLIDRLGAWVLRQACEDAMAWPKHISVSVNVSSLQFKSQKILAATAHALAMSGLAPSRLNLELTETALLENESTTRKLIADLKVLGVKLSLDDFGTGYSSLYHLQHYDFDTIKIDRSFVCDSTGQSSSTAIIRAIIQLAAELGMSTVAEGVETQAQLEALVGAGCTELQGYYLGRPQPAQALLERAHMPIRPKSIA